MTEKDIIIFELRRDLEQAQNARKRMQANYDTVEAKYEALRDKYYTLLSICTTQK